MIAALASNGTNHPLYICSLPWRSQRGQHFLDAQVSHLFSEVQAEDCIAVTKQVTRELVKGKGLPQLLPRPQFRGMTKRRFSVGCDQYL